MKAKRRQIIRNKKANFNWTKTITIANIDGNWKEELKIIASSKKRNEEFFVEKFEFCLPSDEISLLNKLDYI